MGNTTYLRGHCIAPFLDESLFPQDGGFIGGRFCAPISILPGNPTCCLPCPATEWAYSENFMTYNNVTEWLNVVGLVLMVFMLVSYLVLPAQQTRSHYLSVCLIISVIMIAIGFTIPLGAQPEQCFNEITPNDMYTSLECAWSGAFIIAGGLTATTWVFIRALSMNLQICWDIVPARRFFYLSQALGWGLPAALFTATITATSVSFRFGNACHVNHENSMADFWGPLMAIAAGAGILQLMTFGYCMKVYLKNLWTDEPGSTVASGSGLPSYSGSVRTQTARAVYSRLKKVLWLQWRGICIVTIILVDVIFFSIVFVRLDSMQSSLGKNMAKVQPWLDCLAFHPTEKDKCLNLVSHWLVSEPMVVSVLMLLGLTGIQVFVFLTRPGIFSAWVEFFQNKFSRRQEFVSLDAKGPRVMRSDSKRGLVRRENSTSVRHNDAIFEMQKPGGAHGLNIEIDDKPLSSPDDVYKSPYQGSTFSHGTPYDYSSPRFNLRDGILPVRSPNSLTSPSSPLPPGSSNGNAFARQQQQSQQSDYFTQKPYQYPPPTSPPRSPELPANEDLIPYNHRQGYQPRSSPSPALSSREERRYHAPRASFSSPKPPGVARHASGRSATFDPRDVYSRGGLALNPPSEVAESREDLAFTGGRRPHGTSWDRF